MPDEALQAAFEVKAACDDISRKLLRWHWEEKPGAHSVDALMKHLAQRQKESPDYYERLPELNGRTGWQQLDTTLCMRVLLDPEKDAARPLDLLGNTPHPQRLAAPATPCGWPATRPPTPPTGPQPHRRRSGSTRLWRSWKRAMRERP